MQVGYHIGTKDGVVSVEGLDNDCNDSVVHHQLPNDKEPSPSTQDEYANNAPNSSSSIQTQTVTKPFSGDTTATSLKLNRFCCSFDSKTTENLTKFLHRHQCLAITCIGFVILLTLVLWIKSQTPAFQAQTQTQEVEDLSSLSNPENQNGGNTATQSKSPVDIILNSTPDQVIHKGSVPTAYSSNKRTAANLPTEVVLTSLHNLRSITQATHTVIVARLMSPAIPSPAGLSINCCSSVKYLYLNGPISQEWLTYLLNSFPNLEKLEIDVDMVVSEWIKENADGSKGSGIKNLDKTIILNSLNAIYAKNSHNSSILEWGIRLEMPNLKVVSISRATFEKPAFQALQAFLGGGSSRNSIEGIEITESYICPECDVTALQFPKMRYMKITRVKSSASF